MLIATGTHFTHDFYLDVEKETEKVAEKGIEAPPKKKAKKLAKIFDGKYYAVQSESGGSIVAACTQCHEVKKGNELSTGNFLSHYKLKHSSMVDEMKKYLKPEKEQKQMHNQPTLHDVVVASPDQVRY